MRFLEPTGLWLLLFLPLAMLLYMLKLRRQRAAVSSTLLWQKLFEDVHANAFWQWLRRNILLLLQLLAIALLAIAYARPFLPAGTVYGSDLIVVLDNSDSMRTREDATDRFTLARQRVEEIIAGLGRQDNLTVITTAPRPRVVLKNENDPARIASVLRAVALGGAGDLPEALALARQLLRSDAERFVYVFSDGEARELPLGEEPDGQMLWIPCGTSQDNLAIVRADIRQDVSSEAPQLLLAVQNYAAGPAEAMLRIYAGNDLIEARHERFAPGERRILLFQLALADQVEQIKVEMEHADALPEDNVAYLLRKRFRPLRVAFIGRETSLLGRALRELDDIELAVLDPAQAELAAGFDLTIWSDGAPPAVAPGLHCVFAAAPGNWGAGEAVTERPQVVTWDRIHGPLARCNLNRLYIGESRVLAPPEFGRTLVRGSNGPLVIEAEEEERHALVFGFALTKTDLPLRVAFPVFLKDLMAWARQQSDGVDVNLGPGELITGTIDVPGAVELLRPDGSRITNEVVKKYLFTATEIPGFYTLTAPSLSLQYAVTLADAKEANLYVPDPVSREGAAGPTAAERVMTIELWPWFVLIVCLILLVEWWVYHRRIFS